jgi:hypothetical protein
MWPTWIPTRKVAFVWEEARSTMLKAETYGLTTVQPVTLKSPEHDGDAFHVLSKVFSAKSVVKCGIRVLRVILESFWNTYTQHLQGSTFARRLNLWLQLGQPVSCMDKSALLSIL